MKFQWKLSVAPATPCSATQPLPPSPPRQFCTFHNVLNRRPAANVGKCESHAKRPCHCVRSQSWREREREILIRHKVTVTFAYRPLYSFHHAINNKIFIGNYYLSACTASSYFASKHTVLYPTFVWKKRAESRTDQFWMMRTRNDPCRGQFLSPKNLVANVNEIFRFAKLDHLAAPGRAGSKKWVANQEICRCEQKFPNWCLRNWPQVAFFLPSFLPSGHFYDFPNFCSRSVWRQRLRLRYPEKWKMQGQGRFICREASWRWQGKVLICQKNLNWDDDVFKCIRLSYEAVI